MAEKQNLEDYWEALQKSEKHSGELLHPLEEEDFAALNLETSIFSNAEMVPDLKIANEFALVAWEYEVLRNVHPPLRELRECKEFKNFPSCRPCYAWELDGEIACRTLL